MQKKFMLSAPSLITLSYFTIFPEYFISISIIYVLTVTIIITGNVYNFLIQSVLSNCISIILIMTAYLIQLLPCNNSRGSQIVIAFFFTNLVKTYG